ncbi:GGDEF domain-containing protein [Exilibacterium tricleocarpae]|uniref:diguanylate cyclase n=1 Tax=Exilibacterium tricleocarpae TaxID=2591008 RepID=A0A545U5Q6_9GAMM|nr:diguanylate cyclase [Exilibacterium tricleocarpae]TQV84800.1 GGDEF domain-containing protein [Exilibacterium tricleocarpae]
MRIDLFNAWVRAVNAWVARTAPGIGVYVLLGGLWTPDTALAQFEGSAAPGGSSFTVRDNMEGLKLSDHIQLLEDRQANLTISDVKRLDRLGKFAPPGSISPNIGYTKSAWWVKVTLVNTNPEELDVILRQIYPLIDYIDLWEAQGEDNWTLHRTGDMRPFHERDIEHKDFLFRMTLPPDSRTVHYLRYETEGPIDISLSMYTPLKLIKALSKEQLAYGLYYGGFLVLVIYNLFIFIAVRDRVFLYYLLYVVSYGLYMACHNGLAFQFLWPDYPGWGNQSLVVLLALSLFWALQFSRKILSIASFSPRLDKISLALLAVVFISLCGAIVFPYSFMIVALSILTMVEMPLILCMGVLCLLAGFAPARYFMVAWSALIFGVIVYMLKIFGLLPHTFFTENGFQIGSLIEMVLLSLALGSRVNDLKRQSRTDALTSLANRREFDEILRSEFHRAYRHGQPLSLLMIDIDYFKSFNDRFGHAKGDEVLKMVGGLLNSNVRKPNIPCRFGGEEFAVVLPRTNCREAITLAERLRRKVEEKNLGAEQVTISIGLACAADGAISSVSQLLDAADRALYYAKEQGRNRVINIEELEPMFNLVNS